MVSNSKGIIRPWVGALGRVIQHPFFKHQNRYTQTPTRSVTKNTGCSKPDSFQVSNEEKHLMRIWGELHLHQVVWDWIILPIAQHFNKLEVVEP